MESNYTLIVAIVAVVLFLLVTLLALLIYSGLLTPVEIRAGKPPFENLVVAYKFSRGPYKNAGALFTEVSCLVPQLKCIGLYYDDPNEVPQKELRYVVGAVLGEGTDYEEGGRHECVLRDHGFHIIKLPAVEYALSTTFPFKNTLSIFLAVGRVYPKLDAYIKEKKLCAHPWIEIYDDDIIHFFAPLSKQDDFYVPEAKEAPPTEESVTTPRKSSNPEIEKSQEDCKTVDKELPVSELSKANVGDGQDEDSLKDGSGTNGSGEESTGSSFEELNIDNVKVL